MTSLPCVLQNSLANLLLKGCQPKEYLSLQECYFNNASIFSKFQKSKKKKTWMLHNISYKRILSVSLSFPMFKKLSIYLVSLQFMKVYQIKNFFKVFSIHEHFIKCADDKKLEKIITNMLSNSLSGWNKGSDETCREIHNHLVTGQTEPLLFSSFTQ